MVNKYGVFLQVIAAGSLTAAAAQIGYTQSGVSQIISTLESELGFPLLHRGKTGVTPTREAQQLLPHMQEIVRQEELLQQLAAGVKGLQIGTVCIGAITSVAQCWLPEIISSFEAAYPGIDLQLKVGPYRVIENWLLDGKVDCGFTSSPKKKDLMFRHLADDKLLAVLPENHPLAGQEKLPIKALASEPFIIPGEGTSYDIGRIMHSARVKLYTRYSVNNDYVAIAMVKRGIGITILPELLLQEKRDGLCVREFDPPQYRQLGLAVPAGRKASPATELFLAFVQERKDMINTYGLP